MTTSSSRQLTTLLTGLDFGEGPRWHDGRLWFSDFFRYGVFTVDERGVEERILTVEGRPSGIGWLPDGTMLVVSMADRRLLRVADGRASTYVDLAAYSAYDCNDLVVGPDGTAYVSIFGFDLHAEPPMEPRPTHLIVVSPDGSVRVTEDELWFPNGAVITSDGTMLIVGESFGRRYSAFRLDSTGMPIDRRVWAELGSRVPDGCCLDAEGAIWFADPVNRAVTRVAEGGEVLEEIPTEQSAVACALGGDDRKTLFVLTSKGTNPARVAGTATGRIEMTRVDIAGVGLP